AALSLFTFIIMLFDIDFLTAFSTALTCISNVGPGLGRFGPADNGAWFPDALKIILSCAMLLGRLEFYAIVIMFVPEFWKK
ncbi:MAG: TrkH family potassium uptake protein, partial [Desulfovibrionaceae bacterium]|nr:TrkH family potassium uptake protein [Desulfovibrionaceae bacterium]